MFGFRPAVWPTVMTVPALIALIGLGSWQVQRLNWKTALMADMQARLAAPTEALPARAIDPEVWNYRRVTVRGAFDHAKEVHMVSHSHRGNLGYHVYTPLARADGGGVVLINRGWVPTGRKDPASRPAAQLSEIVTVAGIARKGWPQRAFVPDNDPAKNVWFHADLDAIATAMNLAKGVNVPPLFVEAGGAPNPGGYPLGGQTRIEIRNAHLQYAITWYALAVALLVIYLVWHVRRQAAP